MSHRPRSFPSHRMRRRAYQSRCAWALRGIVAACPIGGIATACALCGIAPAAATPATTAPAAAASPTTAPDDADAGPRADRDPGPAVRSELPPAGVGTWPAACSSSFRLCVSPAPGTSTRSASTALTVAEHAWATLTQTLGAPSPEGPLGERWRVYLVDGVAGGGRAALVDRDPRDRFDRGSSFGLVDRGLPPGCGLDLAMARAVARGSLWRAAPGTDDGSALAETETLAHLATPCSPRAADAGDVAAFQAAPQRAIVDPADPSFDRGASLFFDWADARFGARPGAFVVGLWALAPTRTVDEEWRIGRWAGAPTGFDVLRVSLEGALWRGSTLDDVFVRFAIDRATALPYASAVAPSWAVPWPVQARRLSSRTPPAPTGASYVVIDHAGAPPGARLRLEAEWEDYARIRWSAVKLDASGHVVGELPIRSLDRVPRASMTIDGLDGVDRVLVVAANVGSTEHAFDPDQGEWEPHAWLLTVVGE